MNIKIFLITISLLIGIVYTKAQNPTIKPSFQIDYKSKDGFTGPTKDKPQSKLWYMDSEWWAILPNSSGFPSLWQRTENGWSEHKEVQKKLTNIPGQVDVWYENRIATAVGVSDTSLYVFKVAPAEESNTTWKGEVLSQLILPKMKEPKIETATITRDGKGVWWVAADVGESAIYVWSSKDALTWSSPLLIAENIHSDDISAIAAVNNSIIVLWSNQTGDYYFDSREHQNNQPIDMWSVIHRVASGDKTADDHINTALSNDGTLWVTTKSEKDEVGSPNLILRVRDPHGRWENFPYLNHEINTWPSRPVVIATPKPTEILAGHTIYNKKEVNKGEIVFGVVDTTASEILIHQKTVISPKSEDGNRVNDITGPKHPFPADGPWIILASDNVGNVYEADLRTFFNNEIKM